MPELQAVQETGNDVTKVKSEPYHLAQFDNTAADIEQPPLKRKRGRPKGTKPNTKVRKTARGGRKTKSKTDDVDENSKTTNKGPFTGSRSNSSSGKHKKVTSKSISSVKPHRKKNKSNMLLHTCISNVAKMRTFTLNEPKRLSCKSCKKSFRFGSQLQYHKKTGFKVSRYEVLCH